MTVRNRKDVRAEIYNGLLTAVSGAGKPASSVYTGQKKELNKESPVVLVLGSGIQREIAGVGSAKYDNSVNLEIWYLVYNGNESNPLTESQREDALDDVEAACAQWFVDHQKGTTYRALDYTPQKTEIMPVKYIDGNPYLIETALLVLDGRDA